MTLFPPRWGRRRGIETLVCILACATSAQIPTKAGHPPESSAFPDDSSVRSSLAPIESELRRELEADPESAPILFRLGQVLQQENKPKESLEIYTRAARLQKPDAEQLRSVAMDYVLLKLYDDAIHWLQIAQSFDPRNANVLYDLGRCFYTQDRFHEAEEMYLQVLQIQPKSVKAEENLGLTLDMESQPEKAEAALRTAASWAVQQSSDEWPFLNLGVFLLDHRRAGEAVMFLEKATSIAPRNAACHEKLGRALTESGKTSDGMRELETAVQLDPKNPKIHFELGRAYRDAGQRDKARGEFALSQTLYGEHSQD